jgi:hypothetical protein
MPGSIPPSRANLDLAAVEWELIRTGANVCAVAKSLDVPVQQRLDEAQSALFAALRSGSLRRRMGAASYILKRRADAVGGRPARRRTSRSSRKPLRSNGSTHEEPGVALCVSAEIKIPPCLRHQRPPGAGAIRAA